MLASVDLRCLVHWGLLPTEANILRCLDAQEHTIKWWWATYPENETIPRSVESEACGHLTSVLHILTQFNGVRLGTFRFRDEGLVAV